MSKFDKGSRVEIVDGKNEGVVGEVFWWGKSKYGDGMRAGVNGDDGETYWVDAEDLAAEGASKPEPASEPEVTSTRPGPKFEVPFVAAPPRDGSFSADRGDDTVEAGKYVAGLKEGVWKRFTSMGKPVEESEWSRGRRHGSHREWAAGGELLVEGQYTNHRPSGEWRYFHENGELKESYGYDDEGKKHGPYVWNSEDGSPRARGAYWHGTRDGDWEWTNGDDYERSIRSYRRGANNGEAARWYPGGQLEYRTHYVLGSKHGEEKRFHRDGSPAFEGTWQHGYPVGEHHQWDESGTETVTQFVHGLAAELDEDSGDLVVGFDVEKAAKAVKKAKDGYSKSLAMDEYVDFSDRGRALYHLWKTGQYDAPGDPEVWEYIQYAHGLFSGDDVIAFLQDANVDDVNGAHLSYWPKWLDLLVLNVYARDPEPIDAAWEDLPDEVRKGVALVRARFGHDIGDVMHGEFDDLVHEHVHNYGLADRIHWPIDGAVEEVLLFDGYQKEPTEYFSKFVDFFGGSEAWTDALEEEAVALMDDGKDVKFSTFRPVVERADEALLQRLCQSIPLNNVTQDLLRDALFDWRDTDGETITRIALAIDEDGLRKWPLTSTAVLKLAEEGNEIPHELVEAFELGVESPTYSSSHVSEALNAIPEEFRADPHYVAAALPMKQGWGVPRVAMVHEALSKLSEDQVRAIFERHLESQYDRLEVVPYLYFVDDAELWERVIGLVEQDEYGPRPVKTWGFGELGLKAMPLLTAALERSSNDKYRYAWRQAIICALARAAVDGEAIPAEYDQHIVFDLVERDYEYDHISPYLHRLLYLLPSERAEPIIEAALEGEHMERALACVSSHPSKTLLTRTFLTVLDKHATIDSGGQSAFGEMVKGLPNPEEWTRWVLKHDEAAGLSSALSSAVGRKKFMELEEEVENPVRALDHIDKVANLAKEIGGGEQLYLLRRLDEAKHDDLNVIGGAAPGIDAGRWPTHQDEPMEHLYTLDLQTMPELAEKYPSARTISVFCHSPGFNEAWDAGTPETAVLQTSEKQLEDAGEVPDGIDTEPVAWFEVVGIKADLSNKKLRNQIYKTGARVMGEPIWLQEEAYRGDFVMQFDSNFIHMNLGDMGIMYVFGDTAFWQCH